MQPSRRPVAFAHWTSGSRDANCPKCNLDTTYVFQAQNAQNQRRGSLVLHKGSFSNDLHVALLNSSGRLQYGHPVFEVSNERKLANPTRVGRPLRSFDKRSLPNAGCCFSSQSHFQRCIQGPLTTLQCSEAPGRPVGRRGSSRRNAFPSVAFQIHNTTTPPLERRCGALLYS